MTYYCTTNTPWDAKHCLYPHHLKFSSPEPEDSKHCKYIYTLFPYLEHNCWTSRIFPLMLCCTQDTKLRSRCFRLIRGFSWFSHLLLHCRWLHYHSTQLFHNRKLWDLLISVVRQGPLKTHFKIQYCHLLVKRQGHTPDVDTGYHAVFPGAPKKDTLLTIR